MQEEYDCENAVLLNQGENIISKAFENWDISVGLWSMCNHFKDNMYHRNRQGYYKCSLFNIHRYDSTKWVTGLTQLNKIKLEDYVTVDYVVLELFPTHEKRRSYIDSAYIHKINGTFRPRLSVITDEIEISDEIVKVKLSFTAKHFSKDNELLESKFFSVFLYPYDTTGVHNYSWWSHK